jgi:hypothetical protein
MKEKLTQFGKSHSLDLPLSEACFYGFFLLLSLTKGLGFYEGQKQFLLLVVPALILGLAKIVLSAYTKRQAILQAVLLLMTIVVYYNSRELGIVFLAFTVLGMKDISVKKVFHLGLWVWSVCAVLLSVFSFFRLEHTIYRVHAKLGLGHIFRWSLGFTHPNILHITYLALCAFILYELGERYRLKHFVILMAGNLLVFLYSISYTGFGIVTVLLLGCLYVQLRPRFCIVEKLLANLILPICLILSFVLPFYINYHRISRMVQKLNFMLNTRIWLAEQFLKSEYRSLFGADISKVVSSSMTMDNSYVWGYINYGLIPFVIIILGYFALLFYDTHKQRTRELVILVCFLAAGWTEPLLFNTSFKNITLLFLGAFLFRQSGGNAQPAVPGNGAAPETAARPEYRLVPGGDKLITIPFAALPDCLAHAAADIWKKNRRKLLLVTAAGALFGAILCTVLRDEPAGYVVPRSYTDGLEETSVYLESADDPAYADYIVMNYQDADTPMQLVSGKAVKLETVRYYVGSLLIGALAGAAAGTWLAARKKEDLHEER